MSTEAFDRARGQLAAARSAFPVGTFVEHVNTSRLYQVVGHALCEKTLQPVIIYEDRQGRPSRRVPWSRTYANFIELVDYTTKGPGHIGPRFRIVGDDEA